MFFILNLYQLCAEIKAKGDYNHVMQLKFKRQREKRMGGRIRSLHYDS